ncbi:hypothetical protein PV10_06347 [Exophiala mesophila]|uniref:Zinc/iron permease n=2 Tax=Exophiala mesophila TaxID=212818 RepID=A0A0D1ZD33_EXOME|nr:uncharacterized protein PV10_06347 [Exophiala mesophila]KIV91854.1 hypothetical protein PV10_06347 [Exophiala mesophila]
MVLDNDTRGWIMTCISGVACIFGASIICVDLVVRHIPRYRDFSISESDVFLSASLSLSFGVMLFSSLYSMLPQSKAYLEDAGYSPRAASYLLIGLFLAGVVGIQILSRAMHRFIPSHVVDCDHNHEDQEVDQKAPEEMSDHDPNDEHTNGLPICKRNTIGGKNCDEETPLLARTTSFGGSQPAETRDVERDADNSQSFVTAPSSRRPTMITRTLTRTISRYVGTHKENCDESGPCMGFSDPCGQDCFKAAQRRATILPGHGGPFMRSSTWRSPAEVHVEAPGEEEEGRNESNDTTLARHHTHDSIQHQTTRPRSITHHRHHPDHSHNHEHQHPHEIAQRRLSEYSASQGREHHHHVPTNAFMSIGLQTSLAISLHKAPEGFITYATNHANPTLGFAVFMALFIHNITEGFAMSLPLYLALGSRPKAIAWSSFLGGASQPLGAGVAALWFKLANKSSLGGPTEAVYGFMFACVSGIMCYVGLGLFAESLQLSHNKQTCIVFAFIGMAILGISSGLTAK